MAALPFDQFLIIFLFFATFRTDLKDQLFFFFCFSFSFFFLFYFSTKHIKSVRVDLHLYVNLSMSCVSVVHFSLFREWQFWFLNEDKLRLKACHRKKATLFQISLLVFQVFCYIFPFWIDIKIKKSSIVLTIESNTTFYHLAPWEHLNCFKRDSLIFVALIMDNKEQYEHNDQNLNSCSNRRVQLYEPLRK